MCLLVHLLCQQDLSQSYSTAINYQNLFDNIAVLLNHNDFVSQSRFALDGRVPLGMTPPSYVESDWTDHKDTKLAESITAFKREAEAAASGVYDADSQVNSGRSLKRCDRTGTFLFSENFNFLCWKRI